MRIDSRKTVDFVEAVYDDQGSDAEWDARLLAGAAAITGAHDGAIFDFETRREEGGLRLTALTTLAVRGATVRTPSTTSAWIDSPPPVTERLFGRSMATTLSSLVGGDPSRIEAWRETWPAPIADNLGIVGRDPDGRGSIIVTGAPVLLAVPTATQRLLDRVSFHFSAGRRLRRRATARPLEDAEAILSPNGKVLDAKKPALSRLEAIDEGRQRRDEARRTKDDAGRALEIWRGLVAGRWSLVDHFDSDGKRFLLAMKNTPALDRRADLTPRERAVAALVASGHLDKEIRYILGLSQSSVSSALGRARQKLGVLTRAELATYWRALP